MAYELKRPGLSFYSPRHTFETVAGGTRDQVTVNAIMGHAPAASDMAAVYREEVHDARLTVVTEHVRRWLISPPKRATKKASRKQSKRGAKGAKR